MSYNKGWRGRGNSWSARPRNPLVQSEESPPPPLGDLIEAIDAKSFEGTGGGDSDYLGISEIKLIASYNWADHKSPKIIVPGMCTIVNAINKTQNV
jgi:hypothetical protein